jgi:hypothetical protein
VIGQLTEIELTATQVPEGYRVESVIIAAGSSDISAPQIRGLLDAQLEPLVGLRTVEIVTDRGVLVPGSFSFEDGGALGPLGETVESLGETSRTVLPEEPVGVGARWEVEAVNNIQGLELTTITTYEVTDLDGAIVSLDVAQIQQVPVDATMEAVPGLMVDVVEWTGGTSGTTILDLEAIAPVETTAAGSLRQVLDGGVAAGGVIDQTIDLDITITGALGEGCAPRPTRTGL